MSIPNSPPVEQHALNINDLYDEAKNFLDGSGIQSEEQAQAVGKLRDMIRAARKAADAQRAVEKKPHDDAGKAVQAAWKPLLDKCDLATSTCERALVPFLQAKEAEQRAAADKAREDAAAAHRKAQEALAQSAADDLEARATADQQLKDANKATAAAAKLDKARPQIAGADRAIGLRSHFIAELTDARAALAFYMKRDPEALKAWLLQQAQADVRAGIRQIPGVLVREERKAA